MLVLKKVSLILFLCISLGFVCLAQNTTASVNYLTGKFNYRNNSAFVRVPNRYTQTEVYLRKETYRAFLKMQKAALKDGIRLSIISGTRSFKDQKEKWESKWWAKEFSGIKNPEKKAVKLLRWWSMPGTSRHHWGTDIDFNSMKLRYYRSNEGIKVYNWMVKNAASFGFYQPFNANRTSGYQEEKWHWSYAPLSKIYLRQYLQKVSYADISGFKGSETAKNIEVVKDWVSSVNPACK